MVLLLQRSCREEGHRLFQEKSADLTGAVAVELDVGEPIGALHTRITMTMGEEKEDLDACDIQTDRQYQST